MSAALFGLLPFDNRLNFFPLWANGSSERRSAEAAKWRMILAYFARVAQIDRDPERKEGKTKLCCFFVNQLMY